MRTFQIMQPSPLFAPYIKRYWFMNTDNSRHTLRRIIPDGNVSVIFYRNESMRFLSQNEFLPKAFICGQQKNYLDFLPTRTVDIVSVTFQPHCAKVFLQIPMNELLGTIVPISDMEDPALCALQDHILSTLDNYSCVWKIENFLMKRLYRARECNCQRMNAVIRAINDGQTNVDSLSGISCLSYRQFKRIFFEYAGLNPKDFLRIVRFQKVLSILQFHPQIPFTRLAYEGGFYDQSHFINEFKTFSGYTPSEYLFVYKSYSDYFPGLSEKYDASLYHVDWKRAIPLEKKF